MLNLHILLCLRLGEKKVRGLKPPMPRLLFCYFLLFGFGVPPSTHRLELNEILFQVESSAFTIK